MLYTSMGIRIKTPSNSGDYVEVLVVVSAIDDGIDA